MTRQRFEGLRLELCRRIWIQQYGTAKGFIKSQQLRDARVKFDKLPEDQRSYKAVWNSEVFKALRKSVGMS